MSNDIRSFGPFSGFGYSLKKWLRIRDFFSEISGRSVWHEIAKIHDSIFV